MRYKFFSFYILIVLGLVVVGGYGAMHLSVQDNINETLDGNLDDFEPWLERSRNAIVFAIELNPVQQDINEVQLLGQAFAQSLDSNKYLTQIQYANDVDPDDFLQYVFDHLPYYLNEDDYIKIDSLIRFDNLQSKVQLQKERLLSMESFGSKRWIAADPLDLLTLGLQNLSVSRMDSAYIKNQGLFISKDGKKLYFKGVLNYDTSDINTNKILELQLRQIVNSWNAQHPSNKAAYFGTFLIALSNANQLKKDIHMTVTIAIAFIILLLIYYYRSALVLIFFLVPGTVGVLFAIGMMYFVRGQISGLSLGASAIIFGIVADYSFHFFAQLKETKDAVQTRNELLFPLSISGFTTIIAFSSLLFASSKTLQDFGLLTSLSLASTLLFVLIILPHLIHPFQGKLKSRTNDSLHGLIDVIDGIRVKMGAWLILIIVVLTGVFGYFATEVSFEDDLKQLNFYPEKLQKLEKEFLNIDPSKETRLNVLVSSDNVERSRKVYARVVNALDSIKRRGEERVDYQSLSDFILTQNKKNEKWSNWQSFWKGRSAKTVSDIGLCAVAEGFKPEAFYQTHELLLKQELVFYEMEFIKNSSVLGELVLDDEGKDLLITVVVSNQFEPELRALILSITGTNILDGKSIVEELIEKIKIDFNYLVLFASIAVFVSMLLVYGNLELTLVSFLPMFLSWVWILGLSSLLDIKFNFINIIISTFIFGLGDDFSIFITDGLIRNYKTGIKVLRHYKSGIILSSLSTIIGTGVLIFAEHPALKSIAALSVIGIVVILIISMLIQPILFEYLITKRVEAKKPPMTFGGMLLTLWGFFVFVLGAMVCSLFIAALRITPFIASKKRILVAHHAIHLFAKIHLASLIGIPKRYHGIDRLDFSKPSIIIANHTSFMDIISILSLDPKLVIMVNDWVYNSPLFGAAVRYSGFIPAFVPVDEQERMAKELVSDGYSIAVFPEGTRMTNGKFGRFHKGAFFLAEELKLDIVPIALMGHDIVQSKYSYYVNKAPLEHFVLPVISYSDRSFGEGYRERAKSISKYYKEQFRVVNQEQRGPEHTFGQLLGLYRYKGPELFFYFKLKWKYEYNNYERYHGLIGTDRQNILDLGCGYGYLSYFLSLRQPDRNIVGYDFDSDKVLVANNSYLRSDKVCFETLDLMTDIPQQSADCIILADVLHYLPSDRQTQILGACKTLLNPDGVVIIRDGVVDSQAGHKWTEKSERWSTKLVKFNKTNGELSFFSTSFLQDWCDENNMDLEIISKSPKSSNTIFQLKEKVN